ncbi:MAG: CBS domain-containing protein [Erythrobacter sp.]|jgi:CBS domain-containing protein
MTIQAVLGGKGREIISVTAETSVREAVALLAERRIGAVPVMAGGAVAGIFSERDVITGLAQQGAASLDRTVGEVMTAPAITVAQGDSVLAALSLMTQRRVRHLPVVEASGVLGFVSIGDLVKYRIEQIEAEAQAMRAYIQQA